MQATNFKHGANKRFSFLFVLLLLWSLLALACQPASEEDVAPPAGERAENEVVGVAVASVPGFFRVAANDGASFELVPADSTVAGTLTIAAGEPGVGGVNLVAAIEQHKADLLAREGGEYKGQRELGTQFGTAFYSRGQYPENGGVTEETAIFMIHPLGDRTLNLTYRYPASDDSAERIQNQLFDVMGELEPAGEAAATDPPADASADAS